jgi:hypothetical protein
MTFVHVEQTNQQLRNELKQQVMFERYRLLSIDHVLTIEDDNQCTTC